MDRLIPKVNASECTEAAYAESTHSEGAHSESARSEATHTEGTYAALRRTNRRNDRKPAFPQLLCLLLLPLFLSTQTICIAASKLHLSKKEAAEVGQKIWKNECGGTVDGLTHWNVGEEFPSLGIGHFIWYPEGVSGRFEERFPSLLSFLQEHGAKLPSWITPQTHCPWQSREEFFKDFKGEKLTSLREFLASTVPLQTQFLVQRLENALPKMLEKATPESREKIEKQFQRVLKSGSAGTFALIDYVNFKGEGVLDSERYKGQGWGMLQVLEGMPGKGDPVKEFSESAAAALTRRVENSPQERGEIRWLPGWKKRVAAYVPK